MTEATAAAPAHLPCRFEVGDEHVTALFEVHLDADRPTVWRALTDPADLPQWLAPGQIELAPGGAVRLDFGDSGVVVDSRVTAFGPMRLLEYGWDGPQEPHRPVRWEIEDEGDGARLRLSLSCPAAENVARSAAGWAAHLEMLAAFLAGAPVRFPFAVFQAARETFARQLAQAAEPGSAAVP